MASRSCSVWRASGATADGDHRSRPRRGGGQSDHVERRERRARSWAGRSPGEAPDPLREILSRLIDRALVLAEVDRYAPPEPDAAAVDRAVDAVRARFATPEALAAALARVGISETHLRETLRGDLRIRAYLEQRFTVAQPGDEELGRYYRDQPRAVHAQRAARRRSPMRAETWCRPPSPLADERARQRLDREPAPPRRHRGSVQTGVQP